MSYEEMLEIAKSASDHEVRVQEFEPAIIESFAHTDTQFPALEIGNGAGGSAILILAHIHKEGKHRELLTADAHDCPQLIVDWAKKLDIPHKHTQMAQELFVTDVAKNYTLGFVYLDADHDPTNVVRDIGILIPRLAKGAIVAVDDVEDWGELPGFEGLERIEYAVDEGNKLGVHGHHISFWRKL